MNVRHWEPPGVSQKMCRVNMEASMSGEYQTLGGDSGGPWEYLASLMTGTAFPWEWIWLILEHVWVLESTLGAPRSVGEPMREAQTNCERCLGSYGYWFRALQGWSETCLMYTSNRFPSMVTMIHGLLFMITSQLHSRSSSSTVYFLPCHSQERQKEVSDSNINTVTLKQSPP